MRTSQRSFNTSPIGMIRHVSLALGVLGTFVAPSVANAQTESYKNTDFGLVADEVEYLVVDNPTPVLIDQFFYDLTGPFDYTTPTLADFYIYNIRISGRGGIGPLDRGTARGDAAYTHVNWQDLDVAHTPHDGWGVTAWDGIRGRRPMNDVYTTTHIYDYFLQGRGSGLNFTFRDNPYWDNVGGFSVELYEVGEMATVTPEPSTVILLGTGLLGLGVVAWRRKEREA